MTSVKFLVDPKGIYGFCVSGHSSRNCDDELGKIVCSAVSSAVYLVANTVTDVIGDVADVEILNSIEVEEQPKNLIEKVVDIFILFFRDSHLFFWTG